MTDFIAWLDDLDPPTANVVAGAKMGRLSELSRLGFRVPRGFTVTIDAFRQHYVGSGVDALVERQLSTLTESADRARVSEVADAIRTTFEETPVAETLTSAIADAYAELCFRCGDVNQPVAVRSSATGEDAAEASCAGVFDTYLGMTGETRVLAAVNRCWASLFSARALRYRQERGIPHYPVAMAVGVLELVHARVSGVAFSVHPVTGNRERMVIEGTWGWGEAVVQGVVSPDHIEICKEDRRVLSHDVADKGLMSTFDYARGEIVEAEMPARFRNAPILDEEQIGAVADAVCAIEQHYGHPVDVEWVIDRTRRPGEPVSIVQARPVTVFGGTESPQSATQWNPGAYADKYAFGDLS